MFFFSKKKKAVDDESRIAVHTIPADFYGGANPTVKFKQTIKEVESLKPADTPTAQERAIYDKTTAAGGSSPWHPANLLGNKKSLLLVGLGLFVIFSAGAGAYYYYQTRQAQLAVFPTPIELTKEEIVPPPSEPMPVETATTTKEQLAPPAAEEPPPSLAEPALVFPSLFLGETADMDRDELSDMAEEVFQTDPGALDSDLDKYPDGHEIYNLYNPIGKEPVKLIDSNLIKEYRNPIFKYAVYYPTTWALGNTDNSYKDVLFSTLTGEYVEIRVLEKGAAESFADWFGRYAVGQKFEELQAFESKFGQSGYRRNDYMVYYFPFERRVFVLLYHTTDSGVTNYRMVAKMMARSFRMEGTPDELPEPVQEENLSNESFSTSSEANNSSTVSSSTLSPTTATTATYSRESPL